MKLELPQNIKSSEIKVPSDKSISHRAVILSSLVKATTKIYNILDCDDTVATINIFKRIGVKITKDRKNKCLIVKGKGKRLSFGGKSLHVGESGTTIRLLAGLFAAQKFPVLLKGAKGLTVRPMSRIVDPLREMGADIKGQGSRGKGQGKTLEDKKEYPLLKINPVKSLKAITYDMPVPSAQVKSAIMFAGLYAKGETVIKETYIARDHTERALKLFGANIKTIGKTIQLKPSVLKSPKEIFVPGDISSAAFFIALGLLIKDGPIVLKKVGINPTRDGFLKTVKKMGAVVKLKNVRRDHYEPYADIEIYPSKLKGIVITEKELPSMIDELPLIFMLACFAKGKTVIKGAKELKVKETDRIASMQDNLGRMGAVVKVIEVKDNFNIEIVGKDKLKAVKIKSFNDHRTAMAMIIANIALNKKIVEIDNIKCIDKSFPEFLETIKGL